MKSTQINQEKLLLLVLINLIKANGRITALERIGLHREIDKIASCQTVAIWMKKQIERPLNVDDIVHLVNSKADAIDVYITSRAASDDENPNEQAYLKSLSYALMINPDMLERIEQRLVA